MTDKQGRLVKKDEAHEIGYLDIQAYPWLDFDENAILFPDNPRRSVVRTEFHSEREIAEKVKAPAGFSRSLGPKARTIFPQDLTEEYTRSQQEITLRKRKRLLDEEELFNLELADLASHGENFEGIWSKRGATDEGQGEPAAPVATPKPSQQPSTSQSAAPSSATQTTASTPTTQSPPPASAASMTQASSSADSDTLRAASRDATIQALRAELAAERERVLAQAREDGYAAGHAEGVEGGLEEGRAQGRAEAFEQGRAQGIEAGHGEGFQGGFAEGEAKGVASAEARSERYFSLLAAALGELETLKAEVLRAGQDVFVEIANLCAEKVLRQKLGASDAALRELFLQALDMYLESHRVTLEMHPDDAARMRSSLQEAARARSDQAPQINVRDNPALETGDFKLESDKEIMTVDLKRAVEGLIEGLRDHLFGEEPGAPRHSAKKTG